MSEFWSDHWRKQAPGAWSDMDQEILEALQAEMGPRLAWERAAVLEAGCGSGRISIRLAPGRLALVDLDAAALQLAAANGRLAGQPMETALADIRTLPFGAGEFDLTWNAGVLEHFDSSGQADALREMARVTRLGGYVVSLNPHADCLFYRLGFWCAQQRGHWPVYEEPIRTLGPQAARAGLNTLAEYSVGWRTAIWWLGQVLPVPAEAVRAIATWHAGLPSDERRRFPGYLLLTVMQVPGGPPA